MKRRVRGWLVVGVLAVALFAGTMTTCAVTIGIWPGEAKLFAGMICDDAHPDSMVVADRYQVKPGETSTTFSLYCIGPRGETVDMGWWSVMWRSALFHTALWLVVLLAIGYCFRQRQRQRATGAGRDGSPVRPTRA